MGAETSALGHRPIYALYIAKNPDEAHRGLDADRALPVHLPQIVVKLAFKVNSYSVNHSVFRICSINTFSSTAQRVVSATMGFEGRVLARD